jgi:Na+-translocating ferredoxin:NAD+ oxidoreductase RnfA subunit
MRPWVRRSAPVVYPFLGIYLPIFHDTRIMLPPQCKLVGALAKHQINNFLKAYGTEKPGTAFADNAVGEYRWMS